MKILMQNRYNAFDYLGGDTIQMLKTKEYLEKRGLNVDISLEEKPDVAKYDIVHVFNMQDIAIRYSFSQILNAKRQGKKVALSTIYWNFSEIYKWDNDIFKEGSNTRYRDLRGPELINAIFRNTFGFQIKRSKGIESLILKGKRIEQEEWIKDQQLTCLLLSDSILPNANAELELLKKDFKIDVKNAIIIPNAADSIFTNPDGKDFKTKYGVKDFVLCVGRIEKIKNQLNLIRAIEGLGIPLVLIGKADKGEYLRKCKEEGKTTVMFIDRLEHNDLKSAYGAAKVHALPSWRETPGLVSLEAGLAGCNLVVTNRGSTEEYFGNLAYYCEPDNAQSIREAVLKAWEAPKTCTLSEHILRNYTWEKAAEKTHLAYKAIL